jgi:hypothetical protein
MAVGEGERAAGVGEVGSGEQLVDVAAGVHAPEIIFRKVSCLCSEAMALQVIASLTCAARK